MVSVFGVDRSIWEHPDFPDEPFSQREAWLWLVSAAAYQEKRIRGPRGQVKLLRGEFCFSVRFLAEKWLWSKSRVDRFIAMLSKRDMVRDVVRDKNKVYSINNYNKFQIVKAPKRDTLRDVDREESGTTAGQQRDKEKDIEDIEDSKLKRARSVNTDASAAVLIFNETAAALNWPQAQRITKPRASKLNQRLEECGGVEGWRNAMARARASPFLRGDKRNGSHEGWVPDLDFFLQQSSFTKLLEGKYDERSSPIQQAHAPTELERLQHDAEQQRQRLGISATH